MGRNPVSLKWNNHKPAFFNLLQTLREKSSYADVTLACGTKFFAVHRLVLMACSDFFTEVFKNTLCKKPMIVLKDIKSHELDALLDYMYLGEVDVQQADIPGIIKAAECLGIKGLAVTDEVSAQLLIPRPPNDGQQPAKHRRQDLEIDGDRESTRSQSRKSDCHKVLPANSIASYVHHRTNIIKGDDNIEENRNKCVTPLSNVEASRVGILETSVVQCSDSIHVQQEPDVSPSQTHMAQVHHNSRMQHDMWARDLHSQLEPRIHEDIEMHMVNMDEIKIEHWEIKEEIENSAIKSEISKENPAHHVFQQAMKENLVHPEFQQALKENLSPYVFHQTPKENHTHPEFQQALKDNLAHSEFQQAPIVGPTGVNRVEVDDLCRVNVPFKSLVKTKRVLALQQDHFGCRCARISLQDGQLFLHTLLRHRLPTHAHILQHSDVMGMLNPSSTLAFLDLWWAGSTRGRVMIRLTPDTGLARQFVLLCTGKQGHTYQSTKLFLVWPKNQPGECVVGGDYEANDGRGGAPLLPDLEGEYWMSGKTGTVWSPWGLGSPQSAQFFITTRELPDGQQRPRIFGEVVSGLDVVRAAASLRDISEVTVVDCGIVLPICS